MSGMKVKLLVAVMALGLVAAACSSNDAGSGGGGTSGGGGSTGTTGGSTGTTGGSSGSTGAAGGGAGAQAISIKDFAFHPNAITGAAGTTLSITITNNDSPTHSFTLDDNSVSKDIPPGQSVTVAVPLPDSGTVGWHCRFHPTMTGTITVG
jgi:plastocyanin